MTMADLAFDVGFVAGLQLCLMYEVLNARRRLSDLEDGEEEE